MATLNQLVTSLRRTARGGSPLSRDEQWDEELVAFYLEQWRATQAIKNAFLNNNFSPHIDPQLLQDVFPLQLATIDRNEVVGLPDRCTIKKVVGIMFNNTIYPIPSGTFPKIVDMPDKPAITYFGALNKRTNFIYTPQQYISSYTTSTLGAAFGRYFIIGNNIYVIPPNNNLDLCWVDMQCVFLSPREAMSMLTGFTVDKKSVQFWNAEYPATPSMIAAVEQNVIASEFKIMLSTPMAVSNKSTGVQELVQEEKHIG